MTGESPPSNSKSHYITEPLLSFTPVKLENGDLRMAIAKAGQHAYNMWGEEATLTEDFLSRDYRTADGGLVSINHENNNTWVKAKLYDPEYDEENKLVICSFADLPDWARVLIYSESYRGLSQECVPIEVRDGTNDVVKAYFTGVTIVTDPYNPAATQEMGVGIRPELSAILSFKYPTQLEDTMSDKPGGGTPATATISAEMYASAVSEGAELKSQIKTLESKITEQEKEIDSWKKKYSEYESGEAKRSEIAVSEARSRWEADLKATAEKEAAMRNHEAAVTELKAIMSEESATNYLATNPTTAQVKSITAIMKSNTSTDIGASQSFDSQPKAEKYSSGVKFRPDPVTGEMKAEG